TNMSKGLRIPATGQWQSPSAHLEIRESHPPAPTPEDAGPPPGFDEGFEQGYKRAQEELSPQIEALQSQLQAAEERLHQVTHQFGETIQQQWAKLLENVQHETIDMALAIAQHIIGPYFQAEDTVRHLIEEALNESPHSQEIIINVSPQDMALVQEMFAGHPAIRTAADTGLRKGEIILTTDQGLLDGRLQSRLEHLSEQLHEQLENGFNNDTPSSQSVTHAEQNPQ
ncbi:MAG: hypothetical protein D6820_07825, partial [Lentisphaerae bacterium]